MSDLHDLDAYARWVSDPVYRAESERAMRDHDYAPPGGTSNNTHRPLAAAHHAAVTAALHARLTHRPDLWIQVYQSETVTMGDRVDVHGGYVVNYGLVHDSHTAPDRLTSFAWLSYDHTPDGGPTHREERLGEHRFPAPFARDAELVADHILMWLDAHRRTRPRPEPGTDLHPREDTTDTRTPTLGIVADLDVVQSIVAGLLLHHDGDPGGVLSLHARDLFAHTLTLPAIRWTDPADPGRAAIAHVLVAAAVDLYAHYTDRRARLTPEQAALLDAALADTGPDSEDT